MRDNKFAQEFLARRKARGLTQRACAALCGVSTVTVWNWEQGRSAPWGKDQAKILLRLSKDGIGEAGQKTENQQRDEARIASLKYPVAPGRRRRLIDNLGDIGP